MKRLMILLGAAIMAVFVFFTWNEPPEREPYIEGYIVEAGFMRQLVVHGITNEQAADLSLDDVLELEGIDAIWVRKFNFFQYREGQKVRVWVDGGIEESFPAQVKGDYIEVIRD